MYILPKDHNYTSNVLGSFEFYMMNHQLTSCTVLESYAQTTRVPVYKIENSKDPCITKTHSLSGVRTLRPDLHGYIICTCCSSVIDLYLHSIMSS